MNLLEKTRRVNKLLQKSAGYPVDFEEICIVLSELVNGNIYVVSRRGKILGKALLAGYDYDALEEDFIEAGRFSDEYNNQLLQIFETSANIKQADQCVMDGGIECMFPGQMVTIVPINGAGDRLGTLILSKHEENFTEDDLVLAEYSATVVGMEIIRSKSEEIEEEARKKAAVQIAIETLSYSELEAVLHIFEELKGDEGLLVASRIADRVGITRSVIVNALRKFESAGVIESRSLGMKGTYIKVLNDRLLPELQKVK
ncbi:MAG: GTP-sensing pleiotropic transcriptional regulator CodY [Firmicutes bacterium]|nr:GTP-sensing pleiotropic transcriptional regulator CodY [Bacillota bacterium]